MTNNTNADDTEDYLLKPKKATRSSEDIDSAEEQIVENIKDVRYIVREYPAEVVVEKYLKGKDRDENEIYIPDYQRELIWAPKNQSRFIESMLIGLPIPFIFVADVTEVDDPDNSGRIEIVDGVQRIRTLADFMTGRLALSNLERLSKLNGFRFYDLHPSRQRRFRRSTLRLIELTEGLEESVRREMFDRINTGAINLESVEVRRGMAAGPFLDLVTELSKDALLHQLAPISSGLEKRFEYEELVTRFFAFTNDYEHYGVGGKVVAEFLLKYVKLTNEKLEDRTVATKEISTMKAEWVKMLSFVRDHFPDGFQKRGRGRKVPRVRFEAIAVGAALALRESSNLVTKDINVWIESNEFKEWTTSDASNNKVNVRGRIEYVRDKLLGK